MKRLFIEWHGDEFGLLVQEDDAGDYYDADKVDARLARLEAQLAAERELVEKLKSALIRLRERAMQDGRIIEAAIAKVRGGEG